MGKNVYVIGDARKTCRARVLLQYLMASHEYSYSYSDPQYLICLKASFFRQAIYKIASACWDAASLIKFMLADIVYILPMTRVSIPQLLLIKLFSKRVINEFYISRYDTYVVDRKTVMPDSLKAKLLLLLDRYLVDISSDIVFLNKAELNYYLEIIGRQDASAKLYAIPLCAEQLRCATPPYAGRKNEEITVCWWGTFIPLHGVDKILEAANLLRQRNLKFKLYLFGTSDQLSEPYINRIAELGLSDIVVIDNSKRFYDGSLESFLADHCDVALGNFGGSRKAKVVMVNKVVEAASMGLPVVTQRTEALTEYFHDDKNIFFCDGEASAIAEKIMYISVHQRKIQEVGRSARELYLEQFSPNVFKDRIAQVLAECKS